MRPSPVSRSFWTVVSLAFGAAPVQALKASGWMLRGKRIRGWNLLSRAAAANPKYYSSWTKTAEQRLIADLMGDRSGKADLSIAILILGTDASVSCGVEETAESVRQAFGDEAAVYAHPAIQGCRSFAASEPPSIVQAMQRLAENGHSWILPLRAGDLVSLSLGQAASNALTKDDRASIIYWDEDQWNGSERSEPWIKPDWDELIFLARDCLSGSAIFATSLALSASAELDDEPVSCRAFARLVLQMIREGRHPPFHIPLILSHRRNRDGFMPIVERCAHISRHGGHPFSCQKDETGDDFARLCPPTPSSWPNVSIIVPTKDRGDLLEACTKSLDLIQYEGEVEIIVVDNGTTDASARAILDRLARKRSVKVIDAPGPFNFSVLNNLAAKQASGQLLCLLNNDVEAIDGGWLRTMVCYAMLDGVGAVGAQLLYPDFSIQHAGVAIGLGGAAGHVERGRQRADHPFAGWHSLTREVSAVTAACLVVRADLFRSSGGLDEECFPVAFNDVDFCLRLKSKAYRNLLAAEAQLIHHESVSRGDDLAPENVVRFQLELANLHKRWGTQAFRDPHFSPLFSRTSEQCLLAF
jgi:GT2 family glycosyltransferase